MIAFAHLYDDSQFSLLEASLYIYSIIVAVLYRRTSARLKKRHCSFKGSSFRIVIAHYFSVSSLLIYGIVIAHFQYRNNFQFIEVSLLIYGIVIAHENGHIGPTLLLMQGLRGRDSSFRFFVAHLAGRYCSFIWSSLLISLVVIAHLYGRHCLFTRTSW